MHYSGRGVDAPKILIRRLRWVERPLVLLGIVIANGHEYARRILLNSVFKPGNNRESRLLQSGVVHGHRAQPAVLAQPMGRNWVASLQRYDRCGTTSLGAVTGLYKRSSGRN